MSDREIPQWLLGAGVGVFLLLIVVLWYRYIGPGSVPPPPTRMEAPTDGGLSPKAQHLQRQGR
jgi:hypothetical protein